MTFERMNAATAESFRGFFTGIDWNAPEKDRYVYYVACDEDTPVGMLAMDPIAAGPRLLSIGVTPERQNQGIGSDLLDHALREAAAKYETAENAEGCFFEATVFEGAQNYEGLMSFLIGIGFKPTEEELSVSATLAELRTHKELQMRTDRKGFQPMSLSEISNKEYRGILRYLMENDLAMNLDQEELDQKISLVLMEEGHCQAALLFLNRTDNVIRNALVYLSSKVKDRTLLFSLFSFALQRALELYPEDTILKFHGMTKTSNGILERLFTPEQLLRYQNFLLPVEWFLGNPAGKAEDEGSFRVVFERSMKCKNCVHALGKPLECAIYELKPSAVIDGKACPDYQKK